MAKALGIVKFLILNEPIQVGYRGIHAQAGGRMGGENFPQGKFSRNF